MNFLALSQAPPLEVMAIATNKSGDDRADEQSAQNDRAEWFDHRDRDAQMRPASSAGTIISRRAALVTISTQVP